MKHYVYKLEDKITGEYYFGSRSHSIPENDKYMGSMKTWKPNKLNLVKTVVRDDFETREDAILFEAETIRKNINDKLNRNYVIPPFKFHTAGKRWPDEWKEIQVNRMKEYYKENKAPNTGKIFTTEWRTNMSKGRIEKGTSAGSNNANSLGNVRVINSDGIETIYDTIKETARILQIDRAFLSTHIKNGTNYQRGKYKNWKFSLIK